MPKDLFTLKKTAYLYNSLLTNSKINRITQPSDDEIVFTLYNGKVFNVVISAKAKYARVSLTTQEYKNPITAPNFCMLLRKYLLGGTITGVKVNDLDRIVEINFTSENDFKEFKSYALYVEIMGKYSNLFLTSNGILLGVLKNSPQNFEKGRLTLTGAKYLFPLKQDKCDPYDTLNNVKIFKNVNFPVTGNFILNNFLGFAPVTAEEIAFLINEKCKKQCYSPLLASQTLKEFLDKPLSPVIITNDEFSDVFVFDYLHLDGKRTYYDSFLSAEEAYYTFEESKFKLSCKKTSLLGKISSFKKKEEKKLNLLNERELDCASYEKYRIIGELITANIYLIKKGLTEIIVDNYLSENYEKIKIKLDGDLTPSENAQRYFKKYSKSKKALEISKEQKNQTLNELNYVKTLEYNINSANSFVELEEIELELKTQGFIKNTDNKNKKKKQDLTVNCRIYNYNGFIIKCGKNNLQNEALLEQANRNDLWLHVKDYHSSHVIIKSEGKEVPNEVILVASEICAYNSEAKSGSKIAVDITKRKFVKKQPLSRPGAVFYTDFTTVLVNPNEHLELLFKK